MANHIPHISMISNRTIIAYIALMAPSGKRVLVLVLGKGEMLFDQVKDTLDYRVMVDDLA